jgi:hypothetical protein
VWDARGGETILGAKIIPNDYWVFNFCTIVGDKEDLILLRANNLDIARGASV